MWTFEPTSDRYDVVKGDLVALRESLGDFSSSVTSCLDDDSLDDTSEDPQHPESGGAFYYLVRGQCHCMSGTYSTEFAGEVPGRDSGIGDSILSCP
jgi:hypothetical protein